MTRIIAIVVLGALILAFGSLFAGVRDVPSGTVWRALIAFDAANPDHLVVRELRATRAFAALLGGGALGLAGALMQALTRNSLADPGLLGVNAGASFGVLLGIWVLQLSTPSALVIPALLGAALTSGLVLLIGVRRTGPDPVRLVLAGAALGALFLALSWGLLVLSRQSLDIYRYWVLGGFNQIAPEQLGAMLPLFAVGFGIAGLSAILLNPLTLGDDTARALGARVGLARVVSLIAIVLLCGTTVSLAGPIAFIGLLVPHLVRPFSGADMRKLAFGAAVLGAGLAILADMLGRVILPGQEVEAGAIMALIGGPALIILVQSKRQEVA